MIVSVLMPIYNAEKYLDESIQSILSQRFTDFELILIDDGSTDNSLSIARKYKDKRIIIYPHKHTSLVRILNEGLHKARGKYLARMDADDISLPERLNTLVSYLEDNPEIGLLGSWFKVFGKVGRLGKNPVHHEEIKSALLFGNAICHPSVIMRMSMIKKYKLKYNPIYKYNEDYELWTRCVNLFTVVNIPKYLLLYRSHDNQVSIVHQKKQKEVTKKIYLNQLKKLGIEASDSELEKHWKLSNAFKQFNSRDLLYCARWLSKLYEINNDNQIYDHDTFAAEINRRWLRVCLKSSGLFTDTINSYTNSSIRFPLRYSGILKLAENRLIKMVK